MPVIAAETEGRDGNAEDGKASTRDMGEAIAAAVSVVAEAE